MKEKINISELLSQYQFMIFSLLTILVGWGTFAPFISALITEKTELTFGLEYYRATVYPLGVTLCLFIFLVPGVLRGIKRYLSLIIIYLFILFSFIFYSGGIAENLANLGNLEIINKGKGVFFAWFCFVLSVVLLVGILCAYLNNSINVLTMISHVSVCGLLFVFSGSVLGEQTIVQLVKIYDIGSFNSFKYFVLPAIEFKDNLNSDTISNLYSKIQSNTLQVYTYPYIFFDLNIELTTTFINPEKRYILDSNYAANFITRPALISNLAGDLILKPISTAININISGLPRLDRLDTPQWWIEFSWKPWVLFIWISGFFIGLCSFCLAFKNPSLSKN